MKKAKERINLCEEEEKAGKSIWKKWVANYIKTLGLHVCVFLHGTPHVLDEDTFSQGGPFQDPCTIS